ncbi:MAG: hypothetical protein ACK5E3_03280 [Planctomycetota bacterium]|jgi:hypothetical protein
MIRAYSDIVDFIASGTTPQTVVAFCPSIDSKDRVADLIAREKTSELTAQERSELDHYLQIEHIMRLAKAKARKLVSG